ncbi:MAG: peptidyl-dipeptidase Dcp [Candidatus Kryptoniota bacterium]
MSEASNNDSGQTLFTDHNPFARPSSLPFHAPPFDRIHDSDYKPALEEGMREQLVEIDSIASNPAPPTFENTVVALERSGELLNRVSKVFFAVVQANSNDQLQKIQSEEAPKLAAHNDAIYLNHKLFQRVKVIYDNLDKLNLNDIQKFLVKRYYLDFIHAGALLSDQDKEKLRELNQEEAKLMTDFQTRLLAATKNGAVIISDRDELDGLSDAEIASAAEAARERGLSGKWLLTLQNTTQQPLLSSLKNREVRERLFKASIMRAEHADSNDTRNLISRLSEIRAEKAKVIGFPNYAAYVLQDQMAKTPEAAIKMLTDLVSPALKKAEGEAKKLQNIIDREDGGFKLEPWDWQFYAEKLRKEEYDLDESEIKPYFEMTHVLEDGVFYAANKLYGLTFKERKDIPVYNPDVRVFEVYDADGQPLALWYCDYFKRDNKSGGAWEDTFVDGSSLLGTKPVVYNVANFSRPAPGQPALLTFDDVTTMFHEFGHALHAMLTAVEYPRLAGTNVPRDFVEFPSQFNEHWALYPEVISHYARHYKTGEPMPQSLIEKIRKARKFNQGFATTEYLAASLLDMSWHTLAANNRVSNVDSFEIASLEHFHVYNPLIPPRYRSTYFAHIWYLGYAAGYYAYIWSEVLDDDAYAWFIEHGGLTRKNGQRFRDMILSRGGSEDASAMYREFRGHDPDIKALLRDRGLTEK